uniref:Calmodulin n=2 Tax=Bicosoecida sp. CB-2014 TaxID=1486930 RepID=A0A7S1C9B6_9STRA|mmetsp:Transcript_15932/g.55476  ORF Transcript_15932/g.55476 Transcript_15932/m.55476 type:complete len:5975 (+) Transcript_15932:257-18181(+)
MARITRAVVFTAAALALVTGARAMVSYGYYGDDFESESTIDAGGAEVQCEAGWQLNTQGDRCLKFVHPDVVGLVDGYWAPRVCQEMTDGAGHNIGARLTSIRNFEDQDFIVNTVNPGGVSSAYVGMTDEFEPQFYWHDGSARSPDLGGFSNWAGNEPSKRGSACVRLRLSEGGTWESAPCSDGTFAGVFCHYDVGCPRGWHKNPAGDRCYKVIPVDTNVDSGYTTAEQARETCLAQADTTGNDLAATIASTRDSVENRFLARLIPVRAGSVWIGMTTQMEDKSGGTFAHWYGRHSTKAPVPEWASSGSAGGASEFLNYINSPDQFDPNTYNPDTFEGPSYGSYEPPAPYQGDPGGDPGGDPYGCDPYIDPYCYRRRLQVSETPATCTKMGEDGKWTAVGCRQKYAAAIACQMSLECPLGFALNPGGTACVRFVEAPYEGQEPTVTDLMAACGSFGALPASALTYDDSAFMASLMREGQAASFGYLGDDSGDWAWFNGGPLTGFENFLAPWDNNADASGLCAFVDAFGWWEYHTCNNPLGDVGFSAQQGNVGVMCATSAACPEGYALGPNGDRCWQVVANADEKSAIESWGKCFNEEAAFEGLQSNVATLRDAREFDFAMKLMSLAGLSGSQFVALGAESQQGEYYWDYGAQNGEYGPRGDFEWIDQWPMIEDEMPAAPSTDEFDPSDTLCLAMSVNGQWEAVVCHEEPAQTSHVLCYTDSKLPVAHLYAATGIGPAAAKNVEADLAAQGYGTVRVPGPPYALDATLPVQDGPWAFKKHVLVVPKIANSVALSALTDEDKEHLSAFLSSGATLVIAGAGTNSRDMLAGLRGWPIVQGPSLSGTSPDGPVGRSQNFIQGWYNMPQFTPLEQGTMHTLNLNAEGAAQSPGYRPSGTTVLMRTDGVGNDSQVWAAKFEAGCGSVFYLGFDWGDPDQARRMMIAQQLGFAMEYAQNPDGCSVPSMSGTPNVQRILFETVEGVQQFAGGQLQVSWNAAQIPGMVDFYRVMQVHLAPGQTTPTGTEATSVVFEGLDLTATVSRLTAQTFYAFFVVAVNYAGESGPTGYGFRATPTPYRPTPPQNLHSKGVTGGSIFVEWAEPVDFGGLVLTQYIVKVIADRAPEEEMVEHFVDPSELDFVIGGLLAETTYHINVYAENAVAVCTDSSDAANQLTETTSAETVPGATQDLDATSTGSTIDLTWALPVDNGGSPITTQIVVYMWQECDQFGCTDEQINIDTFDPEATAWTITGLRANREYRVVVVAINAVGNHDPEGHEWFYINTLGADFPTEPQNLAAPDIFGGAIRLTWDAPAEDGGADITRYMGVRNGGDGCDGCADVWQGLECFNENQGETECVVSGLNETTTYTFAVWAINSRGEGDQAAGQFSTTAATVPDPPENLRLAEYPCQDLGDDIFLPPCNPGPTSFVLTWEPPINAGGLPISEYDVYADGTLVATTAETWATIVSSETFEIVADQLVSFTVTATQDAGTSNAGDSFDVHSRSTATKAGPPADYTIGTVTGGQVCLDIGPPEVLGGSPLSGYQLITAVRDLDDSQACVDPSDERCVTTMFLSDPDAAEICGNRGEDGQPLLINTTKVFGYYATTEQGGKGMINQNAGPATTALEISAPGPVKFLHQVDATTRTITLSWDMPGDTGGALVRYYDIEFTQAGDPEEEASRTVLSRAKAMAPVAGAQQTFGITYQVPDLSSVVQHYQFRVRAVLEEETSPGTVQEFLGAWSAEGFGSTEAAQTGVATINVVGDEIVVREDAGVVQIPLLRVNGTAGELNVRVEVTQRHRDLCFAGEACEADLQASVDVTFDDEVTTAVAELQVFNDAVFENPDEWAWVVVYDTAGPLDETHGVGITIADDGDAGLVEPTVTEIDAPESEGFVGISLARKAAAGGTLDFNHDGGIVAYFEVVETLAETQCDAFGACTTTFTDVVIASNSVDFAAGVEEAQADVYFESDHVYDPDRVLTFSLVSVDGGASLNETNKQVIISVIDAGDTSPPPRPPAPTPLPLAATGGSVVIRVDPPEDPGGEQEAIWAYTIEMLGDDGAFHEVEHVDFTSGGSGGYYGSAGGEYYEYDNSPEQALPDPIEIRLTDYPNVVAQLVAMKPDTAYIVRVVAHNSVDSSEPSSSASARTSGSTVPGRIAADSFFVTDATGGRLSVSWEAPKDKGGLEILNYELFMSRVDPVDGGTRGDLIVTTDSATRLHTVTDGLKAGDVVWFYVRAVNSLGVGDTSFPLEAATSSDLTLPGTVRDIIQDSTTGGAVTFFFSPPEDTGGVAVADLMYRAHVQLHDGRIRNGLVEFGDFVDVFESWDGFSIHVPGLTESSTTFVSVRCSNGGGDERNTFVKATLTTGSDVIATDVDLRAHVYNGDVITIIDNSGRDGPVEHIVEIADDADVDWTATSVRMATPFEWAGVETVAGDIYSNWSEEAVAYFTTNAASLPAAPPSPIGQAYTGGSIVLHMEPPMDTGGIEITSFDVEYRELGAEEWIGFEDSLRGNVVTYRLAYLMPLTTYEIRVTANNVLSSCLTDGGAPSDIATLATWDQSRSTPPRDLRIGEETGGGTLNVVWDLPEDTGGAAAPEYKLYMAQEDCCAMDQATRNFNAPFWQWSEVYSGVEREHWEFGLDPETCYCLRAEAASEVGTSDFSDVAGVTTGAVSRPVKPAAPTLVEASGGSLLVAWEPPIDDGGTPITSYTIGYRLQGTSTYTGIDFPAPLGTETLELLISGLTFNTTYEVAARAANEIDSSAYSDPPASLTTALPSLPGSPGTPVLLLEPAPTGGALSVQWTAPADDGGVAVEEYELVLKSHTSQRFVTLPAGTLTTRVYSLDYGLEFNIQVRGRNAVGWSALSGVLVAETAAEATKPSPVRNLAYSEAAGGSFKITWSPPLDDGGVRIREFVLQVVGPSGTVVSDAAATSPRLLTGLEPNSQYTVTVIAENVAAGLQSDPTVLLADTTPETPPLAPKSLSVVPLSPTELRLRWNKPLDNGGSALNTYVIQLSTTTTFNSADDTLILPTSDAMEYIIEGLTDNTLYYVRVAAINSIGTGVYTPTKTSTTTAPTREPRGVEVVAYGADWADIKFNPPMDVAGVEYTGYFVEYAEQTGSPVWVPMADDDLPADGFVDLVNPEADAALGTDPIQLEVVGEMTHRVTGLTPGADYKFRVFSRSSLDGGAIEDSPPSLEVSVTLPGAGSTVTTHTTYHGEIVSGQYAADGVASWVIAPPAGHFGLALNFKLFDVECDHDNVVISQGGADIWSGGCPRGAFTILANGADEDVTLTLTSDATVELSGIDVEFVSLASAVEGTPSVAEQDLFAACPGQGNKKCTGLRFGTCQFSGECLCEDGYIGEGCGGVVLPDSLSGNLIALAPSPLGDNSKPGTVMTATAGGNTPKPFGTLAHALGAAAEGDTIVVYPGTYPYADNCDQLLEDANVHIFGADGAVSTILDCAGLGQGMRFNNDASTVTGLTIKRGSGGVGGGIAVVGTSNLVFTGMVLKENTASLGGGAAVDGSSAFASFVDSTIEANQGTSKGGGLCVGIGGHVELHNTVVQDNSAPDGAGAMVQGTASTPSKLTGAEDGAGSGAVFKDNVANDGAGRGGNVYAKAPAFIDNVHLEGGWASEGGGLYAEAGAQAVVVERTTITGGVAEVCGGGVFATGGAVTMETCVVDEAWAPVGAGACVTSGATLDGKPSAADASVIRTSVADDCGGGIYSTGGGAAGFVVSECGADLGGGICADGATTSTFTGLEVSGCFADSGGGAAVRAGSEASVASSTIADCHAEDGGGLAVEAAGTFNGGGSTTISHATALEAGGCAVISGDGHIRQTSMRYCSAHTGGGLAVVSPAGAGSHPTVRDSSVFGGVAADSGGCVGVADAAAVELFAFNADNCTAEFGGGAVAGVGSSIIGEGQGSVVFSAGAAFKDGGGVRCDDCLALSGFTVTDSTARNGGGVSVSDAAHPAFLSNIDVTTSWATHDGGAMSVRSSAVDLADVTLSDCAAGFDVANAGAAIDIGTARGGGLAAVESVLSHDGLTIHANTARHGGGVFLSATTLAAHGAADAATTVSGNEAVFVFDDGGEGGGIATDGDCDVRNIDFSDNVADVGGNAHFKDGDVMTELLTMAGGAASVDGGGLFVIRADVVADRLSLSGNAAANGRGGGLYAQDSTVVVTGDITGNTANNGGGVALNVADVQGGLVDDDDSSHERPLLVEGNTATLDGGGVYVQGAATIDKLHILGNDGRYGGGVYFSDVGGGTVRRCDIDGNDAVSTGGGLHCAAPREDLVGTDDNDVKIEFCDVKDNSASGGGGIAVLSDVDIFESTFTGNVAVGVTEGFGDVGGGGARVWAGAKLTLSSSVFTNNRAEQGGSGGGVFAQTASLTVIGCEFINNVAQGSGGAFFVSNSLTEVVVANTIIQGGASEARRRRMQQTRTADGSHVLRRRLQGDLTCGGDDNPSTAAAGGGIFVEDATSSGASKMRLMGLTVAGIASGQGGALHGENINLIVAGLVVTDACSQETGGAFSFVGAAVDISDAEVSGAHSNYDGGGFFLSKGTSLQMTDTVVSGNSAILGGAAFVDASCSFTAGSGTAIEGNAAQDSGAALYANRDSAVDLDDVALTGNSAGTSGGALFATNAPSLVLVGVTMRANTAPTGGGIILRRDSNLDLTNSQLVGNRATNGGVGGAIWMGRGSALVVVGGAMRGNSAGSGGGIAIVTQPGETARASISGATLADNSASVDGGAMYMSGASSVNVTQVECRGNRAVKSGGGIFIGTNTVQISLLTMTFADNAATSATEARGGGIYTVAPHRVKMKGATFTNNSAIVGGGVWWRYEGDGVGLQCDDCTSDSTTGNAEDVFATQSVNVVISGVPGGPLQSGVSAEQDSGVIEVQVVDFYGRVAKLDSDAGCKISVSGTATVSGDQAVATGGVMRFTEAAVKSSDTAPIEMNITCNVPDAPVLSGQELQAQPSGDLASQGVSAIYVSIGNCNLGSEISEALECTTCKPREYSTDGITCNPCPDGAVCTQLLNNSAELDTSAQTTIGVPYPLSDTGWWLFRAQSSKLDDETCFELLNPLTQDCRRGQLLTDDDTCDNMYETLYACIEGMQFYKCKVDESCPAGITQLQISDEFVEAVYQNDNDNLTSSVCNEGYRGVLCSLCAQGWKLDSDLRCTPCGDGETELTLEIQIQFASIAAFGAIIVVTALLGYVYGAKQFIKNFLCCCIMKGRKKKKKGAGLKKKNIVLRFIEWGKHVMLRPEKGKIVLMFLQIMSGFKAAFRVEWPDNANKTYETMSVVNLDLIRIANIDCVMQTRYFSGFMFLFFAPIVMVLIMHAFYSCRRKYILGELRKYEEEYGEECTRKRVVVRDAPSGPRASASAAKMAAGDAVDGSDSERTQQIVTHGRDAPERVRSTLGGSFLAEAQRRAGGSELTASVKTALFLTRHTTTKLRVWERFSAVPDTDPVLAEHRLCDCIPRDPHADDPSSNQLCARGKIQWKLLSFKTRVLHVLLLLILVSYAPLAQKTLGLWNCTNIGDKWYLVADHKVRCLDNPEWWTFAIWGAVSACMYIIGIPALFYYLVQREKVKHVEWYLNYIFDPKLDVERARILAKESGTAQVRDDAYGISEMSKKEIRQSKKKVELARGMSLHALKKKGTAFRRSIPLPLVGMLNFFLDEDVSTRVEKHYSWGERRHEIHQAVELAHQDTIERKLPWFAPRTPQEKMRVIRRYLYRRNLEATWTTKRLGFVFHSYRLEYWWYELVVMFFKLLMNGVIIFFTTVQLQIVVGVLIAFGAVSLQLRLRPYKSKSDNVVATAMLSTLYLIMFLGLLVFIQRTLRTSQANTALEAIGLVVIFVTLCAIVTLAVEIKAEIKENRPIRNWRLLRRRLMFGTADFWDIIEHLRLAEYKPPVSEAKKKMRARLKSVTTGLTVKGSLSKGLAAAASAASLAEGKEAKHGAGGGAGGAGESKAAPEGRTRKDSMDFLDERDVVIIAQDLDVEAVPKTRDLL